MFLSSANFFQNQRFRKISFRNTIRVSNSLDPDQARRFVGPDLVQIVCKLSADTSRQIVSKPVVLCIEPAQTLLAHRLAPKAQGLCCSHPYFTPTMYRWWWNLRPKPRHGAPLDSWHARLDNDYRYAKGAIFYGLVRILSRNFTYFFFVRLFLSFVEYWNKQKSNPFHIWNSILICIRNYKTI